MNAIDIMWVGVGGGIGSLLRWAVGQLISNIYNCPKYFATLIINISGAFIIAFLSIRYSIDWRIRYGDILSAFVLTGFLGGYTTFSSMQLDALNIMERNNSYISGGYLFISTVCGLLATIIGVLLALY